MDEKNDAGTAAPETLAEVLAELGVCPFIENVNDASMCACGLPALGHDLIAADVVLRDHPAVARLLSIVQARAGEGALRERVEALFAGGPDTSCRTTWRRSDPTGYGDSIECVEVPMDDLRAALAETDRP